MLKHFSAQTAMEPQSVIPLSQGLAWRGQQSMSSIADISVLSAELEAIFTPAVAGSIATDSAIRIVSMVRAKAMSRGSEYRAATLAGQVTFLRASEGIARALSRADRDGSLAAFLKPDLTPPERAVAQVEGWYWVCRD
jgi:hypothetical protein